MRNKGFPDTKKYLPRKKQNKSKQIKSNQIKIDKQNKKSIYI